MPVSSEDYTAISDLLGRYAWAVDAGDEDAYVALWTEDGVFDGAMPEPIRGREALRIIPRMTVERELRHLIGSLWCDYGATHDTIAAHFYNFVTAWKGGGSLMCFTVSNATFVRSGDTWLIASNVMDPTLMADPSMLG